MALGLNTNPDQDEQPNSRDDEQNPGRSWRTPWKPNNWDEDNSGYDQDNPASKASPSVAEQEANTNPDDGQKTATSKNEGQLATNEESDTDNNVPKFTGKGSRKKNAVVWLSRRKMLIGSGGIVGIVAGLLLMGSVLQGPFQLFQLSSILKNAGWHSERSLAKRYPNHFRYMRTGNIGETRVGAIGSRIYQKTAKDLAKIGVTIEQSKRTGQINTVLIDAQKFPGFNANGADSTLKQRLAAHLDIPESSISQVGSLFNVDAARLEKNQLNKFTGTIVAKTADGKTIVSVRHRVLKRYHDINSLFHPLKRSRAKVQNFLDINLPGRKTTPSIEIEKEEAKSRVSSIYKSSQDAYESLKARVGGVSRAINAALFVADTLCTIRALAKIIPVVNYGRVVAPTVVEATNIQSMGDQMRAGDDLYLAQVGSRMSALKDEEGNSVFGGKALNALANGGAGSGIDVENDIRQAYSPQSSNRVLAATVNRELGATADIICSPGGLIVQAIAGITLAIFTGGSWTVARAGSVAASAAITTAATAFAFNKAVGLFAADPVEFIRGPIGGNLLAFGARAAYNSTSRGGGGTEISDTEEQIAYNEYLAEKKQELQSKSFASRVFDVMDYRSVASQSILALNTDPRAITSSLTTAIAQPINSVTALISPISQRVYAEEAQYNWGFPIYGIPDELLSDPAHQDPYANADKAALILNNEAQAEQYISKASECFGVSITKGSEGWQVRSESDTNPALDGYDDAKCNDLSDRSWRTIVMFIYDSNWLTAYDCYEGNTSSCAEVAVESAAQPNASTPTTTTPIVNPGSYIWPLEGKPPVSACWNDDRTGYKAGYFHSGLDISAADGTNVVATRDGKASVLKQTTGGTGITLLLDHGDGYFSQYQHLERILVSDGQTVKQGEVIAISDNTGRSTGSHLHFNIQKYSGITSSAANTLNPLDFLPADDRNMTYVRGNMAPLWLRGKTVRCVKSDVDPRGWVIVDTGGGR